jgi:hypothetical protein
VIKAPGYFKQYEENFVLFVTINKKYFDKLKEHICNNMFFAFRRVAPKYKTILLTSIGDHLDKEDSQNLLQADICIEATLSNPIEKQIIDMLDSDHTWFVCALCEAEAFMFSLDKDTQFIKDRRYVKDA